jgi:hypothetical protein
MLTLFSEETSTDVVMSSNKSMTIFTCTFFLFMLHFLLLLNPLQAIMVYV